MRFATIEEATRVWVETFNAYPQWMIKKMAGEGLECLSEITPPSITDRVYVFENGEYGEITKINPDGKYEVELDNEEAVVVEDGDFEIQRDGYLPMWGTMWSFNENIDNEYFFGEIFDGNHLQEMADCGFRVYEYSDRDGNEEYFFGIDGAGYDFYESHWVPLYKVRGLEWHDEEKKEDK